MCCGRLSEDLLGAGMGSCLWKMEVRTSGSAMVTIDAVVPGSCVVQGYRSLVLYQDLAGS